VGALFQRLLVPIAPRLLVRCSLLRCFVRRDRLLFGHGLRRFSRTVWASAYCRKDRQGWSSDVKQVSRRQHFYIYFASPCAILSKFPCRTCSVVAIDVDIKTPTTTCALKHACMTPYFSGYGSLVNRKLERTSTQAIPDARPHKSCTVAQDFLVLQPSRRSIRTSFSAGLPEINTPSRLNLGWGRGHF